MPELKPLPCPAWACQGELVECKQDGESFFIECKECGMRGPVEPDPYHAQQSWDWIPRALTWTTEPPKVAGWYWVRIRDARYLPKIVEITAKDIEQMSAEKALLKGNREWAGPITPPRE